MPYGSDQSPPVHLRGGSPSIVVHPSATSFIGSPMIELTTTWANPDVFETLLVIFIDHREAESL